MLALAGAACGGDDGGGPAPASATVRVLSYEGDRLTDERLLDCAGADAAACAAVIDLLPELVRAPDEVCTEIYGGPQRRVVEAVVDGAAVVREVTRVNGCEIDRFDRLAGALGASP